MNVTYWTQEGIHSENFNERLTLCRIIHDQDISIAVHAQYFRWPIQLKFASGQIELVAIVQNCRTKTNKKWQFDALNSNCHTSILRSLFDDGWPHIFVECLTLAANKFVPSSMHSSIDSLSSKRFSMWLILNSTPCSTKIHKNSIRKRFRRKEFHSLPWHIGQATLHWKQSHRKCFLRILSRRRFASTFDTLVRWISNQQRILKSILIFLVRSMHLINYWTSYNVCC